MKFVDQQKRSRSKDTKGQNMLSVLDEFPVQETYIAPTQLKMAASQKRPRLDVTTGQDIQSVQFPLQEAYIAPNQLKMKAPEKKPRSDDPIGQDMLNFLDQFPMQDTPLVVPNTIENVLGKLEQDVTCIKTNLEKKRSKATISQLNDKVDQILLILKRWEA